MPHPTVESEKCRHNLPAKAAVQAVSDEMLKVLTPSLAVNVSCPALGPTTRLKPPDAAATPDVNPVVASSVCPLHPNTVA